MHNMLPPLKANSVVLCDLDDKIDGIRIYALDDDNELSDMISPDFSTVGAMGTEPKSLDEALCGPNQNKWQAVLMSLAHVYPIIFAFPLLSLHC